MFEVMRAAVGLQRASQKSSVTFPTVENVIRMATLGGAEVLGLSDIIGSLQVGKRADIIVLNPNTLNGVGTLEAANQVVYTMQERNIEYVFIDGVLHKTPQGLVKLQSESILHEFAQTLSRTFHD